LKRKLWLLNIVLIAAIAAVGWRLRKEANEFHDRERKTLLMKMAVPPAPPVPPAAPTQKVAASSYLEIAQKMLFSKDRNPQVILDPPKPPEPPKPLPKLPSVSGVMDIGDGPIVMMSDKPGARSRGVRQGETIGEFKLVSVNGVELTLEWEDRTVTKKLQDLIDRAGPESGPAQSGAPVAASSSAASAPPPPPAVGKPEPGVQLSEGVMSCQTNDPSPAGTVVNGMRKVVSQTPFGSACSWVAVK
jgi:hypothetical protein